MNKYLDKKANLTEIAKNISFESYGKYKTILLSGPTYANAKPHLGTIFNICLKDSIVRMQRAFKKQISLYISFDTHGEPISKKIEHQLQGKKISKIDFIDKCKDLCEENIKIMLNYFNMLGINYEKSFSTSEKIYMKEELDFLYELYVDGNILFDNMHTYSCVNCKTALSLSELAIKEYKKDSFTFFVKTTIENLYIMVWTTTPYSIIGNKAITYGNFEYVIININSLDIIVLKKWAIKNNFSFKEIQNSLLYNQKYFHPVTKIENKLLFDEKNFVTEEGTGFVHLSGEFSEKDHDLLLNTYNMPTDNNKFVNDRYECLTIDQHSFVDFNIANENMINFLKKNELYFNYEQTIESGNTCWRCFKPVVQLLTKQLYLDLQTIKPKVIDNISNIKYINKKYLQELFEKRKNWCLSRQKNWGIFIPIVRCINTSNTFINKEIFFIYKKLFEKESSWLDLCIDIFKCKCGSKLEKVYNVLDVWFDAGFAANFAKKKIELICEGEDQNRGWYQTLMILSKKKYSPKKIITHPYLVNENNDKLSKSLNNFTDIDEIIEKYPNDILRILLFSSDLKSNLCISEKNLENAKEAYIFLRTNLRFLLSHSDHLTDIDINVINEFDKNMLFFVQNSLQKNFDLFQKKNNPALYINNIKNMISLLNQTFLEASKKDIFQKETSICNALHILAYLINNALNCIMPFTTQYFINNVLKIKNYDILFEGNKKFIDFIINIKKNYVLTDNDCIILYIPEYIKQNTLFLNKIENIFFKFGKKIIIKIKQTK